MRSTPKDIELVFIMKGEHGSSNKTAYKHGIADQTKV